MRGHLFLRGIILPIACCFSAALQTSLWAEDAELIEKENIVEKKPLKNVRNTSFSSVDTLLRRV